jgi:hypothetical protein
VKKSRTAHPSGATLLELLISIGIAALLLATLILLFTHSQKIFFGEGSESQELRSLGTAMERITDTLSSGSVYLLKADPDFLLGKPSSQITVEQFSSLYHSDKLFTFSFDNHQLMEKEYSAVNGFSLAEGLKQPDKQIFLASRLQSAEFAFKPPHALVIMLQDKHLILRTEISTIQFSLEYHP